MSDNDRHKRLTEALAIVDTHAKLAIGAGIIPVPMLDIAAITLVMLRMLKQLSEKYEKPFSDEIGQKIVGAVLGGYGAWGAGSVAMRMVPGLNLFAALAMPGAAFGITKALGTVFVRHFEVGGTIFTAMRDELRKDVQAAMDAAK